MNSKSLCQIFWGDILSKFILSKFSRSTVCILQVFKKSVFSDGAFKNINLKSMKVVSPPKVNTFFFFFDLLNELFELCVTCGRFITTKKSIKSLHCVELSRLLSTAGLSSCFISTGVASNKNSYSNGLPYKSYSEKFRKIHKNSFSRVFLK